MRIAIRIHPKDAGDRFTVVLETDNTAIDDICNSKRVFSLRPHDPLSLGAARPTSNSMAKVSEREGQCGEHGAIRALEIPSGNPTPSFDLLTLVHRRRIRPQREPSGKTHRPLGETAAEGRRNRRLRFTHSIRGDCLSCPSPSRPALASPAGRTGKRQRCLQGRLSRLRQPRARPPPRVPVRLRMRTPGGRVVCRRVNPFRNRLRCGRPEVVPPASPRVPAPRSGEIHHWGVASPRLTTSMIHL